MANQVFSSRTIAAPADVLYAMVSDVTRMGEWSPETTSCRWTGGATGPAVGARFWGVNKLPWHVWATKCTVTDADPGRRFAFDVDLGLSVSNWAYDFTTNEDGTTTVTETWTDRRGWLFRTFGALAHGVRDREAHNRTSMDQTLEGLATAAEQGANA